jgi:transcriptional regulator with XRE-family HTH domain
MSRSEPKRKPKRLAERKQFGSRVRALRENAGFSQEGFALHANIDRAYVGGVERGERNVSLDNIHYFAEALGVDVRDLF